MILPEERRDHQWKGQLSEYLLQNFRCLIRKGTGFGTMPGRGGVAEGQRGFRTTGSSAVAVRQFPPRDPKEPGTYRIIY